MDTKPVSNKAYQAMLIAAAMRRRRALQLQRQGKTLREIGEKLGVSGERARQMIAAAMKEEPNA